MDSVYEESYQNLKEACRQVYADYIKQSEDNKLLDPDDTFFSSNSLLDKQEVGAYLVHIRQARSMGANVSTAHVAHKLDQIPLPTKPSFNDLKQLNLLPSDKFVKFVLANDQNWKSFIYSSIHTTDPLLNRVAFRRAEWIHEAKAAWKALEQSTAPAELKTLVKNQFREHISKVAKLSGPPPIAQAEYDQRNRQLLNQLDNSGYKRTLILAESVTQHLTETANWQAHAKNYKQSFDHIGIPLHADKLFQAPPTAARILNHPNSLGLAMRGEYCLMLIQRQPNNITTQEEHVLIHELIHVAQAPAEIGTSQINRNIIEGLTEYQYLQVHKRQYPHMAAVKGHSYLNSRHPYIPYTQVIAELVKQAGPHKDELLECLMKTKVSEWEASPTWAKIGFTPDELRLTTQLATTAFEANNMPVQGIEDLFKVAKSNQISSPPSVGLNI